MRDIWASEVDWPLASFPGQNEKSQIVFSPRDTCQLQVVSGQEGNLESLALSQIFLFQNSKMLLKWFYAEWYPHVELQTWSPNRSNDYRAMNVTEDMMVWVLIIMMFKRLWKVYRNWGSVFSLLQEDACRLAELGKHLTRSPIWGSVSINRMA